MLDDNYVSISVDRKKYSGWSAITISKSLENLASSFDLVVIDKTNQKTNAEWLLRTQKECAVYIGKDKIITGFIEKVDADISFDSHNIKVSGRTKTADLIDCNYTESNKSFSKKSILTLARTLLEPFNINVSAGAGADVSQIFQFTVNSSDSIFKSLNQKANDLGLLLLTDSNGNLLITNSGNTKCKDSLEYGKSILSAEVSFDYTDRFSDYIVQAQTLPKEQKGAWATNINIQATSKDISIVRNRPKVIKVSSPLTRTTAQEYANWEALVRAAQSQTITIQVQGFRDGSGAVWDINKLIDVKIPPLYINPITELLITGVDFSLSENGTITKLTLKRKDAYIAKPFRSKKVQSLPSLGWDKLKRNSSSAGDIEE